jgi:alpha-tubulin suppressor-like RCC1 family protein
VKTDGTVVGWRYNASAQANPPVGTDCKSITIGNGHGLAIKTDNSLVGWGNNNTGQATVPAGNGYVAIAIGDYCSLALKADESIVTWGFVTAPAGYSYVAMPQAAEAALP